MNHVSSVARGLAFTTLLAVASAFAGGTVVKLDGEAAVDRKGQKLPASEAFPIQSGDTLKVAEHSKAQVRFEDDSIFAIPGATTLRVDEFRMPARGSGGKAIYTLEDGGFRTLTGRVGKGAKDEYELRTALATVKVEGSAYSTLICKKQCGRRHKSGFYVRSESGVIVVTNTGGQIKLQAGQIAYVESEASAPVIVKVSPFGDPQIAAEFGLDVEFDTEVHPPRIEPENPASPS